MNATRKHASALAMTKRIARYWSHVDVRGPDECWHWTAFLDPAGYGRFSVDGKKRAAHRFALELRIERPVPDGVFACHTCDNPPCCNPAHIFEGTPGDNTRDMIAKGRSKGAAGVGTRNSHCKLTEAEVLAIRATRGKTHRAIADDYGVSPATISMIMTRAHWGYLVESPATSGGES